MLSDPIEIIYRYDPNDPWKPEKPEDPRQARELLERGNREFAAMLTPAKERGTVRKRVLRLDPEFYGVGQFPGEALKQQPFAATLGCSDARVPTEMIFNRGANDLFVVRVAGNVLGDECLGSLRFAVQRFPESVKLVVVLGHSGCGAVTEAVDAFLNPAVYMNIATNYSLRTIVDQILVSVRMAALAIEAVHGRVEEAKAGYRRALIETAVAVNCVWNAYCLQEELRLQGQGNVEVVYGIYDLATRCVGLPFSQGEAGDWERGLFAPPASAEEFNQFARGLAASDQIERMVKK